MARPAGSAPVGDDRQSVRFTVCHCNGLKLFARAYVISTAEHGKLTSCLTGGWRARDVPTQFYSR